MRTKELVIKVNRLSAWALIALMAVYFLTGYGMTRGLISPEFSKLIHNKLLPIPSMLAFAIHSAYAVHLSLKRWRVWRPAWSAALVAYVTVLVIGVIVFHFVLRRVDGSVTVPTTIEL